MPQRAWLRPDENPFGMSNNRENRLHPIAIGSRAYATPDLRDCLYNSIGDSFSSTPAELQRNRELEIEIARKVSAHLIGKFEQHLRQNRCRLTGPDDCVLVSRLWVSLAPDSVEVAKTLQSIELEVGLHEPLPTLKNIGPSRNDTNWEDSADRRIEIFRRFAFLRSKMLSVLSAPNAWPSDALAKLLPNIFELEQALNQLEPGRFGRETIDHHYSISPWNAVSSLGETDLALVRQAISHHVMQSEPNRKVTVAECEALNIQLSRGGHTIREEYIISRWATGRSSPCANPDWVWLTERKDPEAAIMRETYLSRLDGMLDIGRVVILSNLTSDAHDCFKRNVAISESLKSACQHWISEPPTVNYKLKNSGLSLKAHNKFRVKVLALPNYDQSDNTGSNATKRRQWLIDLAPKTNTAAIQDMNKIAADFAARGIDVGAGKKWFSPNSNQFIIELTGNHYGNVPLLDWPFNSFNWLIVVNEKGATLVGIPGRLASAEPRGEIKNVSDLDGDGNFEIWLNETYNNCNSDAPRRNTSCSVSVIRMGEISGDVVSYFRNNVAH
jgi:hypothetical protein